MGSCGRAPKTRLQGLQRYVMAILRVYVSSLKRRLHRNTNRQSLFLSIARGIQDRLADFQMPP